MIEDRARGDPPRGAARADAADVVLIAGKGHEDYQEIAGVKQPVLRRRTQAREARAAARRGAARDDDAGAGARACCPARALVGDGARARSRACTATRAACAPATCSSRCGRALRRPRLPGRRRAASGAVAALGRARPGRGRPARACRSPTAGRARRSSPRPGGARFALPLIAVTGSNGKTTVTQMIAAILRAWLRRRGVRHRGQPQQRHRRAADAAAPAPGRRAWHRAAVVELGMNHPGEIALLAAIAAPTVALVNNAQREHQEFMASVEAVARENGAVIAALWRGGRRRVPGRRCARAAVARAAPARGRMLTFALQGAADVAADAHARTGGDHWAVTLHTPGRRGDAARCASPAGTTCSNALAASGLRAGRRLRRSTRDRARPRGLRAGQGPLAGCSASARGGARVDAGRRHLQRQPRFGARRDRRAGRPARPALAGARRHGRGRRPGAGVPRRGRRLCARARHRARCGRSAPQCAHAARGVRRPGARTSPTSPALIAALAEAPRRGSGAGQGLALHGAWSGSCGAAPRRRMRTSQHGGRACCLAWPSGCRRMSPEFGFLRVFQYLTFRAVMAAMTALLIGLVFGPWVIRRLTALKIGQPVRDYGMRVAPHQERHADHGRRADPDRHRRLDAAVVRLEQPLRLDRAAGDASASAPSAGSTTGARWCSKNPEGMPSRREVLLAVGDRPGRRAVPRVQRVARPRTCACSSCSCAGCRAASRTTCRPRPT